MSGKDPVPMKVRGEFPRDLLKWVTSPSGDITEAAEVAIDHVLHDRKKRAQVFLTALARKHVERIVYLISKLPLVEEELFRDVRIKVAKTSDLIRLLGIVGVQVKDASEFLRVFVSDDELRTPPPPPTAKTIDVEGVSVDEREAATELSAESRKRLTHIIRRVTNAIEVVEKEESTKRLPPPKKKG